MVHLQDAYGNLCSNDSNNTVTAAIYTGGGALAGTTAILAPGGVAAFTNLAALLNTSITLRFTSSGVTAVNSGAIEVRLGPYSRLQVLLSGETAAPGTFTGSTGTPAPQTVGVGFEVTVRAVDLGFNAVATVTNQVTLSSTSALLWTSTNMLANGTNKLTLCLKTAGSQSIGALDLTDGLTTGASSPLTLNAGALARLQLLVPGETAAPGTAAGKAGVPAAQTAGTAFSVTVNAVDAYWNVVPSADGTHYSVQLASSDANADLPGEANLNNGTKIFSGTVMLKTAGVATTLTVSDVDSNTVPTSTSPAAAASRDPLWRRLRACHSM